jgi:hypothetical protein
MQIEVTEYWPTFVDRDESTRRVTLVKTPEEIPSIDWIQEMARDSPIEVCGTPPDMTYVKAGDFIIAKWQILFTTGEVAKIFSDKSWTGHK